MCTVLLPFVVHYLCVLYYCHVYCTTAMFTVLLPFVVHYLCVLYYCHVYCTTSICSALLMCTVQLPCVLYYGHRVSTQLQLTNISYYHCIISVIYWNTFPFSYISTTQCLQKFYVFRVTSSPQIRTRNPLTMIVFLVVTQGSEVRGVLILQGTLLNGW
jgi:hypothetical protein